mgnify:CR=1 FL=1
MESRLKKPSYTVGIKAPEVSKLTADDWRSLKIQVDPKYLPYRSVSDLLAVLNKARYKPDVETCTIAILERWALEREKVKLSRLTEAQLDEEELKYVQSISPTWESLVLRDAADLALLIEELVEKKILHHEATSKGDFSVAGELKRLDYVKSSARKKLR